jgi:hypothetical protein
MKLGDLVRTSQNPTSFLSALRIFLSRFGSRRASRSSRGSYESVLVSLLSRVISYSCSIERPWSHSVLHRPRSPGSHVTIPLWSCYGHPNLGPRKEYRPCLFPRVFLIFEQNQRTAYREVLIAGDLSQGDVDRARNQLGAFQVSLRLIEPNFLSVLSRVLPKRGLCYHMAQAHQTTSSSLSATIPCISLNQVCRNSCLVVLGLGHSMPIELHR